jgi:hypothetical protein
MSVISKKYPPVFISDVTSSKSIHALVKAGSARKIGPRLYTVNMTDDPEFIIRQNVWQIVLMLFPGSVVSNRTALEAKISPHGKVYLTGEYTRTIKLTGVTFVQTKGTPALENDMPWMGIFMSSRARSILENVSSSRIIDGESKNLSIETIEQTLAAVLNNGKEAALNKIRDEARNTAKIMGLEKEFATLDTIAGALLRTRTVNLSDPLAKARSRGVPYDPSAIAKITSLWSALIHHAPFNRQNPQFSGPGFFNCAFFDAYFSNYIEGTKFNVEKAKEIIESGEVPFLRPADGHDILGTYRVVSDFDNMKRTPKSPEMFLDILTGRHSEIMAGRPEKHPGKFKEEVNYAGATKFVDPDLVTGTLLQGFEMYRALEHPFSRALFIMFLVAEVHPFDDGNGRTARIMMNSELVAAGLTRIIIPSVFREEYVSSLKRITNHQQPESFIRVMSFAQEFAHLISFEDYESAKTVLESCNAFHDPSDNVQLILPKE